ncbi:hypothetical protein CL619_03140 [archaeon]|nr:hypothetical protein [archaeon]
MRKTNMKNQYTFLDHTADVLFQATAKTIEELFRQAGLATFATMTDLETVGTTEKRKFTITANTIEYLLFDFLDELLMFKDSEILFFSDFKINIQKTEEEKFQLNAVCFGEPVTEGKHDRKLDVKAITLHLFEVKEVKDGWSCQVLLDI